MSEVTGTFPLTRAVSAKLIHLDVTGSTNDDLIALATAEGGAPDGTVVVSLGQTAGKGRLERRWTAPPGQMLAASILVRPAPESGAPMADELWGWLPLVAGFALKEVLMAELPDRSVGLKWPNDVQVGGDKIAGILAELTTRDGRPDAVVLGVGLNLTIERRDLPTATSTSLLLQGRRGDAAATADEVLAAFVERFRQAVTELASSASLSESLRARVAAACDTVGRRVRVELPGGDNAYGTATALDPAGRLVVLQDDNRATLTVSAGDVTHLRYE